MKPPLADAIGLCLRIQDIADEQIRTVARYPQPTTDEELESAKAEIDDLRKAVSDALAEDLGAEPEDYDATRQPVVDGGESLTLRWLHTYIAPTRSPGN